MFPRDSILGCLFGGAIGDAMGGPREGRQPLLVDAQDLPAGSPCLSDDTQLTLATCEALTECGLNAEADSIAASMARWFGEGRITGVGASTYKALSELCAGQHWRLSGARGERAAGNGAAMRAAPLAFALDPAKASDRARLRDICGITHHNDEAWAGALAVVACVRAAATGACSGGQSLLPHAIAVMPDCRVRDALLAATAFEAAPLATAAAALGTSGYVVESVPFALLAASQVPVHGFEPLLRAIVRQGGDADTIASIAGQVAGASLGAGALPPTLLATLPEFDLITGIAQRFADAVHARLSSPR